MSRASAVPGGFTELASFDSPHDGDQVSVSADGSESVGFHDSSVGSSNSSAPLKVPKPSGVAVLEIWRCLGEREGESEGVSEIGELGGLLLSEEDEDFSSSSDVEVGNCGSWTGTVLSGMVSNVECAGCHVEDGSFLQSDASVRLVSPQ